MLPMFNCVCLLCGKEFTTYSQALRKGQVKSCGCYGKVRRREGAKKRRQDLTGQTFQFLLVNSPAEDVFRGGKWRTNWNCLCLRCGNKTTALTEELKAGNKISCGCYRKERLGEATYKSLNGQIFSELYVDSRAPDHILPDGTPQVMYNCICSCGEHVIVSANNLRSGNTKSCGHLGSSAGEAFVLKILQNENINYKHDSGFSDLKSSHGGYPRFDFKIFDDNGCLLGVIEVQGEQHYKETTGSYSSDFGKFQREETDQLKKDYCFAHNIPLYEIRYDEDYEKKTYEILKSMNVLHVNPVPSLVSEEGQTTISQEST